MPFSIKKYLKYFIPPIIIYIVKYLFLKRNSPFNDNTYYNRYEKVSDIKKEFAVQSYVNLTQNEADFLHYMNMHEKQELNFNLRESILPIFLASNNFKHGKILDVGGGYNSVSRYIDASSHKDFNVTVLERHIIADTMNNLSSQTQTYITSFGGIKVNEYEIIYFGSSFQYFLKLDDILSELFKIQPIYIIIADSCFLEKDGSFLTLQVNMYPSIFPQRFTNLSELAKRMKDNDYNLIYKSRRNSEKHSSLEPNEYYNRDLIFRKNDHPSITSDD